MKGKVLLLAGAAVGYVLGSRAGRQRYEQIKRSAEAMWRTPAVQDKVLEAEDAIKTKAPEVQEKLVHAANRATEKVKATVQRHDAPESEQVTHEPGQLTNNDNNRTPR